MVNKLDKKDFKILRALDTDSRMTYSALERVTLIPAETIRYRLNKLIDSGIIQNFLTVIDGGKLGYYYYKVFFKLHNVDDKKVQQIIEYLSQIPEICWVVRVDEVYDIAFTPRVTNPAEQSALLDELRQKYSQYILEWTLSVNISMDFFSRDYLTNSKRPKSPLGTYTTQNQMTEIDESSKQIISILSMNARASASEIAAELPISSDTVLDRIKMFIKKRIIVRFTYVLNNGAIGQVNYYVLVYLNNLSTERESQFKDFCRSQPNITYMIKALGAWDYELNIEARNVDEYRLLMMKINHEFSDIVYKSTGMMVRDIYKYRYP